jgi:LysR family transcriptional regulator, benzoate and cis,cis-muconate-responsive activator of ben and cat genes
MQSRNLLEVNVLIVVIAQEGSFVRAAKKLGIAAPSLTRRVSMLEKSIGVRLFERTSRRVELTRAKRLFVQEAALSLNHSERAWDLARYQAQVESGPYRIGYSPCVHSAFLTPLNGLNPVVHPPGDEPSGIALESANTLELLESVQRALRRGQIALELQRLAFRPTEQSNQIHDPASYSEARLGPFRVGSATR